MCFKYRHDGTAASRAGPKVPPEIGGETAGDVTSGSQGRTRAK